LAVHQFKLGLAALAVTAVTFCSTYAQQRKDSAADSSAAELIALSQQHFSKGESCFAAGNMECARREFDTAIDTIVNSGADVRSDAKLLIQWRQLVEQIGKYQAAAAADSISNKWKDQEYAGVPEGDVVIPRALAEEDGPGGPLSIQDFRQKFEELKTMFREKYSRDLVVTGADHEEHRRLYGSGSAFDIRVRDLSSEQVSFIITTGQRLGLHVKDFSTPEKVAIHNARVASLGLPSDTLATSVHIHIDRNTPYRTKEYISQPASKKSTRPAPERSN